MTTENDQPAEEDSGLDVDLGKVFDEVNKAEDHPEDKTPPPAEEPKVEETPSEPKEEEPPPVEEPAVEEPSEEVVAPASWTAEAKEKFGGLDPVLQQEMLKREKDYAQGIQKNADLAKEAESYDQVIAPYKAMIASENATPQQAVANLLNTAYQLRTATPEQKTQLILNLAQQYGADLSQTSQEETDEYVDPDILSLKNEIASLKTTTQSQLQANQNQQVQALQQQIQNFSAETNADGSLKHEHFDKVKDSMAVLLTGNQASNLEEAYNKSLYMVDEVRESMILKQVKENEAVRVKKETDAAQKAKKAQGLQLQNEQAGAVPAAGGSLDDDLGAAYDAANAKAS